jgi:hypothetical protein
MGGWLGVTIQDVFRNGKDRRAKGADGNGGVRDGLGLARKPFQVTHLLIVLVPPQPSASAF